MAYATLDDMLEQVAEADLIALTDDDGAGAVSTSVVDRAIENAGAVIDSYCAGRCTVPFSPVPEVIRMTAVDLAVFNLYSRRTHIETPPVILERQRQAVSWLKRVQDGLATVGPAPAQESMGASFVSNPRLFTRNSQRWP